MGDIHYNHQGAWMKVEDHEAANAEHQKRIDELTAENERLKAELAAVQQAVSGASH